MKLVTLDNGPCPWCKGHIFRGDIAQPTFQMGHTTPVCDRFVEYMNELGGRNRRSGTLTHIHTVGSTGTFIDTPEKGKS